MNSIDSALLTECDKEQIQNIAFIQPFGILLAVDAQKKIVQVAVSPDVPLSATDLLGSNIKDMFLEDTTRIYDALEGRSEPTMPFLIRNKRLSCWLTCIAHQQADLTIFEVELLPPESVDIPSVKFIQENRDSLESYLSYIAENVQAATGYDRVMIYRFAPDWHGEVIAEALHSDAYPFFGHHFPASDIPVPARNLFKQNWLRIIADVDAVNVPLKAVQGAPPLDLTKSVLRAASSIHLDYLRNMGVAASLTLSLICDGKLWGLIACHHFSAKYLGAEERSVFSLLAKVVSSRITSLSVAEGIAASNRVSDFIKELATHLSAGKLYECIRDHKNSLLKLVTCTGFSFVSSDATVLEGHTPSVEQLKLLASVLTEKNENVITTDSIAKLSPKLVSLEPVAAGIIAIRAANGFCIWNRPEVAQSILWAGNPSKPVYANDKHSMLSPRTSFESWKEQVKGMSNHWQQHEVEAVERLRYMLLESIEGKGAPQRLYAHKYLRILRTSINNQAAELQNQFTHLNLDESLPPNDFADEAL